MKKFPVAFTIRSSHAILKNSLKEKGWTQKKAAEFMGINQNTLSRWINLKKIPKRISLELEIKLYELTGKTITEIWPKEVFNNKFLERPKIIEIIRDIPFYLLEPSFCGIYFIPNDPEKNIKIKELRDSINKVFSYLTSRQRRVIYKIYLEEKTFREIAEEENITVTRVDQVKSAAIRKLRHPLVARHLLPFL